MATAGGKVIVAGEHAVVYGVPAVAVGLRRGVEARSYAGEPGVDLRWTEGSPNLTPDQQRRLEHDNAEAYRRLLGVLTPPQQGLPALRTVVQCALPTGVGLGGSAAIAVAVARAVREAQGLRHFPGDASIAQAAAAWESVFHGTPSGIDVACATYGGCLRFTKEAGPSPVRLKEPITLCVCVAGKPSSTREMVASVARIREENPHLFTQVLEAIRALVQNVQHALITGDAVGLGQLMNYNQMLLASWFLSNTDIERACSLARNAGALGAKLTGAGGGGSVVAVTYPGRAEPILNAWREQGLPCFAETLMPTTN